MFNTMNEGELVIFTLLLYQSAIFICRYVSPVHTMTVEITNDHIHLWGSEVAPDGESLIWWLVDTRHHKIVQFSLDYVNILWGWCWGWIAYNSYYARMHVSCMQKKTIAPLFRTYLRLAADMPSILIDITIKACPDKDPCC